MWSLTSCLRMNGLSCTVSARVCQEEDKRAGLQPLFFWGHNPEFESITTVKLPELLSKVFILLSILEYIISSVNVRAVFSWKIWKQSIKGKQEMKERCVYIQNSCSEQRLNYIHVNVSLILFFGSLSAECPSTCPPTGSRQHLATTLGHFYSKLDQMWKNGFMYRANFCHPYYWLHFRMQLFGTFTLATFSKLEAPSIFK